MKDHCRAIDTIIDKGVIGETYLIGVNNERTNIEVLQKILLQLEKSQEDLKYIADRTGNDLCYGIDASKLYAELFFTIFSEWILIRFRRNDPIGIKNMKIGGKR